VPALQRSLARTQQTIGSFLRDSGKIAAAIKACESALAIQQKLADANPDITELQSDLAISHSGIGLLLSATGKTAAALKSHEAALAVFRKLAEANPSATEFQVRLADAYNNLASTLRGLGRPAEATRAHKSALAIRERLALEHPESPDLASALGGTLNNLAVIDLYANRLKEARPRLREAIQWQRKAMAVDPANPTYRQFLTNHLDNLARVAQELGDVKEAAEVGAELTALRDSDPAIQSLDARLAAIVKGDQHASDEADRLQLAQRAYDKAFHATATRFWAEALIANPKLGDDRQAQHRYNAACAAALAGTGQGKDNPMPDDAARSKLRSQALGWLQAELAAWAKLLESGPAQARSVITQTLQHWKQDSDLAGVRDADALARLPERERKEWLSLWADVDTKMKRAAGKP
jgi:tetratricopeptide (TPR) repeat protein